MISNNLPAPTKAEALRMDLLPPTGCICCWLFAQRHAIAEVHHLTTGGKHGQLRRGHAFTLGLCCWHHRGIPGSLKARTLAGMLGPSYALQPLPFRRMFGRDELLLRIQSERLAAHVSSFLISPGRYADPVAPGGFAS